VDADAERDLARLISLLADVMDTEPQYPPVRPCPPAGPRMQPREAWERAWGYFDQQKPSA